MTNDPGAINGLRAEIKAIAAAVLALKDGMADGTPVEVIANLMLAYRHLEDASMRLGKVLQALDDGASVYDRRTTVGA